MVAGVTKGFLTGLDPQISEEVRMSLDRISLIVVVSGIDQLKSEVIPNWFNNNFIYIEDVHAGFWTG